MPIGPVTLLSYNTSGITPPSELNTQAVLDGTTHDGDAPVDTQQPNPNSSAAVQQPAESFLLASNDGDIGGGAWQKGWAEKFYEYLTTHSPQQILDDVNNKLFELYTSGLTVEAAMKWGPALWQKSLNAVMSGLSQLPRVIRAPMWNVFNGISQNIERFVASGAVANVQKLVTNVVPAAQKVLAVLRSPLLLGAGTFIYSWGWLFAQPAGEDNLRLILQGNFAGGLNRFWNELDQAIVRGGGDTSYVAVQRKAINDLISIGALGTAKSLFEGVLLNLLSRGYMSEGFDPHALASKVIDEYAQRLQSAK